MGPSQERPIRRSYWAALALSLGVTGVLLLAQREQEPPPSPRRTAAPRLREAPAAPARARAISAAPPASVPAPLPPARDPLLTALPVKPDSPIVVFEVNALRYSALGERILACVRGQGKQPAGFSDVMRRSGIDPLTDVDRVAFLGRSTVVSGHFDRARWSQLGGAGESYGQSGRIYTTKDGVVGTWHDQIAVLSPDANDARSAIDQLDGRAPAPKTELPAELSAGEIYGLIPGAAARQAFGGQGADDGLTNRLASLASQIEIHVDTMQDLAAEVRVRGDDPAALSGVAETLGAALTAARLSSRLSGNKSLSALLEKAAVRPSEQGLSIQLSVPAERLDDLFEGCKLFGSPPAPAGSPPATRAQEQEPLPQQEVAGAT